MDCIQRQPKRMRSWKSIWTTCTVEFPRFILRPFEDFTLSVAEKRFGISLNSNARMTLRCPNGSKSLQGNDMKRRNSFDYQDGIVLSLLFWIVIGMLLLMAFAYFSYRWEYVDSKVSITWVVQIITTILLGIFIPHSIWRAFEKEKTTKTLIFWYCDRITSDIQEIFCFIDETRKIDWTKSSDKDVLDFRLGVYMKLERLGNRVHDLKSVIEDKYQDDWKEILSVFFNFKNRLLEPSGRIKTVKKLQEFVWKQKNLGPIIKSSNEFENLISAIKLEINSLK